MPQLPLGLSPKFSFCPWCDYDLADEEPSEEQLKAPKGLPHGRPVRLRCAGRPDTMPYCHGRQGESWNEGRQVRRELPALCPGRGRWMDTCHWCGKDATGQDLIRKALHRVRVLLKAARIPDWGFRVLLRPGVSGVDPKYPKIVEIEQRYIVGARRRDEIPWQMLIGLISHELGHSFLYHHWHWTRAPAFRRTFGSGQGVPVMDDAWVDSSAAGGDPRVNH